MRYCSYGPPRLSELREWSCEPQQRARAARGATSRRAFSRSDALDCVGILTTLTKSSCFETRKFRAKQRILAFRSGRPNRNQIASKVDHPQIPEKKASFSGSRQPKSQLRPSEQPSREALSHRCIRRPRRLALPDPRHGRPLCNARVTAELHMQARRSRTSFAGQRHAPHPSAMARRAAAALHEGDSSARSFPAALHDFHLDGCRWPRS